jgi:hypothetical protein
MSALLWKEFRETVRWFPFCLLLVVVLLWMKIPGAKSISGVESLSSELVSYTGVAAFIVAVALAGAQFAFDQKTSARAFLHHRKQSAREIFHAKVAIGSLLYALALFVPLIYTAFYLEWMGPERLPTTWYQTVPAMTYSFFCFSFYFGVSLVVSRPARWLGTKLIPLFASVLITLSSGGVYTPVPINVSVLVLGLASFLLLAFASRSVFEKGETCAAFAAATPIAFPTKSILFLSSLVALWAAFEAPNLIVWPAEQSYQVVKIDSKGEPWLVNSYRVGGINANQSVTRLPIVEDASKVAAQEIPEDWREGGHYFVPISKETESGCDFRILKQTENGEWFLDDRGRILAYEYQGNQKGVIGFRVIERKAAEEVSKPSSKTFNTLKSNQFLATWQKPSLIDLFFDAHGVYVIGPKDRQIYTLLDKSIDGFSGAYRGGDNDSDALIVLASGKTVTIYRVEKSDSNPAGFALVEGQALDTAIELGSYGNTFVFFGKANWPAPTDWTWVSHRSEKEYRGYRKRSTDEKPVSYTFQLPNKWLPESLKVDYGPETTIGMSALSLLAQGIGNLMSTPDLVGIEVVVEELRAAAPMIAVMAILATLLTCAMARVRRLTTRQQIVWSLIGFLFGIGAALAVLAIYPQVHSAQCPRCGRKRRVDRDRCENCNAKWELPVTEGIEIIEPWAKNCESRELLTH